MLRKFYTEAGFMALMALIARGKDLVSLPILTYRAGDEVYGAWTQACLLSSFVAPVLTLGLHESFVRFASGLPDRKQAGYLMSLLLLSVATGTGALLVVWVGQGAIAGLLFSASDVHVDLLLLGSAFVVIVPVRGAFESWLFVRGKAQQVTVLRTVNAVATIAGLLVLTQVNAGFIRLATAIIGVEALLAGGLLVWFALSYRFVAPSFDWFRQGIRYGLPLIPGTLSMLSVHYVDRLMIPHYGSLADVGVYAFAYSIGQTLLGSVTMPFKMTYGVSAYTYYNQGRHDELRRVCRHAINGTLATGLPTVAGLFLFGDLITGLLAPPEFEAAGSLIGIVGAAYLAWSVARVYQVNIGFSLKTTHIFGTQFATCLLNILLNAILIAAYGIYGAAAATLVSILAGSIAIAWIADRKFHIPLDFRYLAEVSVATAGMFAIISLARPVLGASGAGEMPAALVSGGFAAAAYALIALRATKNEWLRSQGGTG